MDVADPARARARVLGNTYESQDLPLRAYLVPVLGTRQAARQYQRMLTSLRAADLLAVEPDLKNLTVPTLVVWDTGDVMFPVRWAYWLRDTIPGVTKVVELSGARLFFPDERASDLVTELRRHWSARPAAPRRDLDKHRPPVPTVTPRRPRRPSGQGGPDGHEPVTNHR